jgi:hypothetical protein
MEVLLIVAIVIAYFCGYGAGKFDERRKWQREQERRQTKKRKCFDVEKYRAEQEAKIMKKNFDPGCE